MKPRVTVVDYGVGNLYSVTRAFEHAGAEVLLTGDAAAVRSAERLVLPGVGAFRSCVEELHGRGLAGAVREFARCGRPMLGICVGMQMLFDESDEFGVSPGLGLVPGRVTGIPDTGTDGAPHKIPHIGWNELRAPAGAGDWNGTILQGLEPGEATVYFVHSFTAQPADAAHRLADSLYDGRRISAVVCSGNMYGCQFHPEKSGETGLAIVANFIRL